VQFGEIVVLDDPSATRIGPLNQIRPTMFGKSNASRSLLARRDDRECGSRRQFATSLDNDAVTTGTATG